MNRKRKQLVISILIPLAVGALSSLLTRDAMKEFGSLNQPPLSPPGWLFPVVWIILYILMGIASYLIYRQGPDRPEVQRALRIYALQLAFNFFWSILFFNYEMFLVSFVWLVILWILILVMIGKFSQLNKAAAKLTIPYLLWVTFAGYLNLGIFLLN